MLHCKNKWVEVTHAWLPELQLSFDVCNSGNHAWVISIHLFLQCRANAGLTYKRTLQPQLLGDYSMQYETTGHIYCIVTLGSTLTTH